MLKDYALNYFILNGKILEVSTLVSDKFDLKSKKIYEVIRIANSNPIFLVEHLQRLKKSLELENEKVNISIELLQEYIEKLIKVNNIINNNIKIILFISNGKVETLMYPLKSKYPESDLYQNGVKVSFIDEKRHNPNAKVLKSEYKKNVNSKLKLSGSYELLLVDEFGMLSEGSRSNLFFIKDDKVITAKSEKVLMGITRMKIIETLNKLNIEVIEKDIHKNEVVSFDGAFLSGTSINALPICKIEKNEIKTCDSNVYKQLNEKFNKKWR
ncbi:aminotransferase class IV [Helicovermis profundi]|uniref:Aminotransferase class IV n=1 Tax=Helicovermis profundi TaxID=3065157 RepID=A0AAU9E186_9FIRM|nr:aminotransferase class IV [Clostridia bacterium S502]